jgi:hypothetical protein
VLPAQVLVTITLEVAPFYVYAPFPALLPFFLNASVRLFQHRLQFRLHYLSCVKMAAFQFYLQLGKQRKVGVGDDSHVVFGQKNSLVKKEVRDGALW